MGRRSTLVWLVAVIAGVFMVVPTLANAQEQGSTEADSQITDEATADEPTTTEDPAAETPPAEAPADAVAPAEPTEPAVEPAAPADTSKAAEPEASSAPAPAPAPAEAAAPEPAPAEVAAAEAKATSSPGNDGGGSDAKTGRAVARGGGELEATVKSSESKPGCLARGNVGDDHAGFPADQTCAISQFQGGLPSSDDGVEDLEVDGVSFDIWEDPEGTVNFTVLSGGPFTGAFYVKGGPVHNQCLFTNVTSGSCLVGINPNNGNPYGFSHLDVCVGENPPPPPPPDETTPPEENTPQNEEDTPGDEVLTEQQQEQRDEQQDQQEEAAAPPVVPTAVTPAPEEALPFTGLDTGWLLLLSVGLLGSGVLLRRKVS